MAHWALVLIFAFSIPVFIRMRLYRTVIRYMGGKALYTIVYGVTLTTLMLFFVARMSDSISVPLTVFGIYWAFAALYIGGSRLLVRDYFIESQRLKEIAIYGAGSAGVHSWVRGERL